MGMFLFCCSLNFIPLLRVVITPSVMLLLRGENDSKQSDEFQASFVVDVFFNAILISKWV